MAARKKITKRAARKKRSVIEFLRSDGRGGKSGQLSTWSEILRIPSSRLCQLRNGHLVPEPRDIEQMARTFSESTTELWGKFSNLITTRIRTKRAMTAREPL